MIPDAIRRPLLAIFGLLIFLGCKGEAAKQEAPSAAVSS